MRLNIAFLALLSLSTLALGLVLRELPLAREGDLVARGMAFATAPVLIVSVGLLLRIVSRVDQVRRSGKELQP